MSVSETARPGPARVAILGGGPAGLAAAFHLTEAPDWRDRYRITVYQMGWRLGGKCATGRDPASMRIQEHGIHLFANFYTNTFHMLRAAYAHLYGPDGSQRPDEPIRTMAEAFPANDFLLGAGLWRDRWVRHDLWAPGNDDEPWAPGWEVDADRLGAEVADAVATILTAHRVVLSRAELGMLGSLLRLPVLGQLARWARRLARAAACGDADARRVALGLSRLVGWLLRLVEPVAERSDSLRWTLIQVDLLATLLRGVLADRLLEDGVDRIDHLDYRSWLRMHGASNLTLGSTLPQMVSNICFEYESGDTTHGPRMSARGFVVFQLRALLGKGAAMYFFRAGTGETVVTPIYRTLRERGVDFAFFHKVTGLRTGHDGTTLTEIDVDVQATPVDPVSGEPRPYEPLFSFKGLHCWPDRPDWDQLAEGDELRALDERERQAGRGGLDLESWWAPWRGRPITLRHGVDFDHVVLAIPVGALPHIATDLIHKDRRRWAPMIAHVQTTTTQQVQVWLDRSAAELGWQRPERFGSATWVLPMTDVVDLTDLLEWEGWPEGGPRSLLYFCGPLQELDEEPPFSDHGYPQRARDRVMWSSASALRSLRHLLPGVAATSFDLDSFDFDLLHVPAEAGPVRGENRLRHQFVKANVDPNERYVLSLPGSDRHRLSAWGSGVANLFLCGDWIDNGINVGSFEAAVTSGMLASHALTGHPALAEIAGYAFLRPNAPSAPPGPLWPAAARDAGPAPATASLGAVGSRPVPGATDLGP